MNQPHEAHWSKLKWLLRQLKSAPDHGILFSISPAQPLLSTYTDTDSANGKNRRSTSGIVQTIHAAPISWASSIQDTVALSTREAQYLTATLATQQTKWLCRLLSDFYATPKKPVKLHIDNQAALHIALQSAHTKRRKRIDIRHHSLHDHIEKRLITTHHIPSNDNPADLSTKPLGKLRFHQLVTTLSLTDKTHPSITPSSQFHPGLTDCTASDTARHS